MTKMVALKPRVSEKTYALAEKDNTYVFEVTKEANKHDVARAIAAQYDVSVVGVRLFTIPGKGKRSFRRGGRSVFKGQRSDTRKAYVTLAADDKLPIFSAIEEASIPEEKK